MSQTDFIIFSLNLVFLLIFQLFKAKIFDFVLSFDLYIVYLQILLFLLPQSSLNPLLQSISTVMLKLKPLCSHTWIALVISKPFHLLLPIIQFPTFSSTDKLEGSV